jgi:hypothetical protein
MTAPGRTPGEPIQHLTKVIAKRRAQEPPAPCGRPLTNDVESGCREPVTEGDPLPHQEHPSTAARARDMHGLLCLAGCCARRTEEADLRCVARKVLRRGLGVTVLPDSLGAFEGVPRSGCWSSAACMSLDRPGWVRAALASWWPTISHARCPSDSVTSCTGPSAWVRDRLAYRLHQLDGVHPGEPSADAGDDGIAPSAARSTSTSCAASPSTTSGATASCTKH